MANIQELMQDISSYGEENKTENKREFSRFDTQLKAQFFSKGNGRDVKTCTVLNISRNGMGLQFHTPETIRLGSPIHLEITVPAAPEPFSAEGTVKWINQKDSEFIGGIEWFRPNGGVG
ncbi:MAG: PilZ domain-containing protein [Deltaproteobacteria bacterium]|nr:PilZ domain-containing protein [Deltaproteobacteria bacterium]